MEELVESERLLMFGSESEFKMSPEYSKNNKTRHYREQALDYYQSIYDPHTMDALVPYVAMNFFDRVISKLQAPPKVLLNKQENFSLFLISCYSISWKLRDSNYDIYKFLLDRKYKFGNKGLMRMEMSILQILDWNTKQTLPFRFVPYFLHFLTLPRGFTRLPVHKIIVWTQADIRFTKFRPSTVAASAILCTLAKLFPDDSKDFTSVILSRYAHFDSTIKDELAECVEMILRTYENKMNTLVMAEGLINDGVGTSQKLNLAPGEASTGLSESGKKGTEERSHRHGRETVAEEATEGNKGIETVPEQSSSPADDRESLEDGSQRQMKESVAEEASTAVGEIQIAPNQSSSPADDRESLEDGSQRQRKESVAEEASTAVGEIQIAPNQSSSPADDRESLEDGSQRQRKESVTEEASTAVEEIQTAPNQSSSPGNGQESPVKPPHRPGKEPIDEESSEAIDKIQMVPKRSSNSSDDDPEEVKEGFCKPRKVPMVEIEGPEFAVADSLLMNFELGWDDQNPYSHGYGMCSLCDALARCWPIPIFEAQEQTLDWLRDSWEWLMNLPEHIGIPNRQAAQRPWEPIHEADSESSPETSCRIQDFFPKDINTT